MAGEAEERKSGQPEWILLACDPPFAGTVHHRQQPVSRHCMPIPRLSVLHCYGGCCCCSWDRFSFLTPIPAGPHKMIISPITSHFSPSRLAFRVPVPIWSSQSLGIPLTWEPPRLAAGVNSCSRSTLNVLQAGQSPVRRIQQRIASDLMRMRRTTSWGLLKSNNGSNKNFPRALNFHSIP